MSETSSMSLTERVYNHLCLSDISLALFGLFVFCCLHEKVTNKQGPKIWPVFGITPEFFLHRNDVYAWVTRSLKNCQGTFLFHGIWLGGSSGAVTSVPANVEHMLKNNFKNFPKGSFFKDRFDDLLEDGIFNADNDSWKEQRRIFITEMHSTRFVEHSFQTTQDLVRTKLLKVLDIYARSQEAFDLQDVFLRLTFDNICIAGLGDDPGTLDSDLPLVPFAKAFEEATESTMFRFMIPSFIWKPMRFLDIGYEKRLRKAVAVVHEFVDKIVVDRIWFFWEIQKHPEVEDKIIREIKEIIKQRGDHDASKNESLFTVKELNDMVYLQDNGKDGIHLGKRL